MKSKSSFLKIWNIMTTVIVVIVVVIALFLMGSRIVGLRVFNVVSGSMEPKYSIGDLIYVKNVDPDSIKVGDTITFVLNEDLVVATHNVIAVDKENTCFRTQGLANDAPDAAPVHFNNLIGKPAFSIPYLGYVSAYIQSPPGMYVAIALGVIVVLLVFLPDMFAKKKKEDLSSDTVSSENEESK